MNATIAAQPVKNSPPTNRARTEFVRLMSAAFAGATALAVIGFLPTSRLAGREGLAAMATGIGISVVASLIGAGAIVFWRGASPADRQVAFLAATCGRMLSTLILFAVVVFSSSLPRPVLAIWTGISYLMLLAIETLVAVGLIKRREASA